MPLLRKKGKRKAEFPGQQFAPLGADHPMIAMALPDGGKRKNPKAAKEPSPQELAEELFKLEPKLFKENILDYIEPLPENATKQQRIAKMKELFDHIKKGGTLGIEYQFSGQREPKTPNEVLLPGKDGARRADCDEYSLLFISAAKKLNIDLSDVQISVLSFEMENISNPAEKRTLPHAAILTVGTEKYLIDPAIGFMKKMDGLTDQDIIREYIRKEVSVGTVTRYRITKVLGAIERLGTPLEMAALHFREAAKYHLKQKDKKSLGKAEEAILRGLKLKPNDPVLVGQAESLQEKYLDFARSAYEEGNYREAEEYAKKKIKLYGKVPSSSAAARKEASLAHTILGSIHSRKQEHKKALTSFESAVQLDSGNLVADGKRILALCDLKRYADAERGFEAAYKADKKDARVLHLGLEVYYRQGKYAKVIEIAEAAIKLDKSDLKARHYLVSSEINFGQAAPRSKEGTPRERALRAKKHYELAKKRLLEARKVLKGITGPKERADWEKKFSAQEESITRSLNMIENYLKQSK